MSGHHEVGFPLNPTPRPIQRHSYGSGYITPFSEIIIPNPKRRLDLFLDSLPLPQLIPRNAFDESSGPDDSTLKFRLLHFWEARKNVKGRPGILLGIEMLMIDAEVCLHFSLYYRTLGTEVENTELAESSGGGASAIDDQKKAKRTKRSG
ncbi:hypothetical protein DY000_02012019 [Brassica cretica]|uniref:Uncharacterized protein n=1 Tax=Brassica cretica TaxID=69181 RepID=A0ABQ7CPU7_BRACR|nr:hypothetical protein DY000_02012019 [Brassica cretica]